MTTLQSYCKATLYSSYCPPNTNPYSETQKLKTLGQSSMSIGNVKDHEEPKTKHYRYERVNNTFKLVEVKSNNGSDPKEQIIHEEDRVEKLSHNLHDLTNRVIALEFHQAKLPTIENQIFSLSEHCNSMDGQLPYFGEKVALAHREIGEMRERLEEVEEQEADYQRQLAEIYTQINMVRQEGTKNQNENNSKIEYIIKNLKSDMERDVGSMKENICPNSSKSIKLSSLESMVTRTSIEQDDDDDEVEECQVSKSQSKLSSFSQSHKQLKYRESYHMQEGTFCVNEIAYKIDGMGRLLDEFGFVILDSFNKEVRLDESHIKKLRDFGLIL